MLKFTRITAAGLYIESLRPAPGYFLEDKPEERADPRTTSRIAGRSEPELDG